MGNRDYLDMLKRLGIICLIGKDKFGVAVSTGSLFLDSRLSYLSKLLNLIDKNWDELGLHRFLPEDIDTSDFLNFLHEAKLEYVNKETYLHMTYKQILKPNGISVYELPSVCNYESVNKEKTRLYYNLIPDKIVYVLQRIQIPKLFITKFHLYCTTSEWSEFENLLVKSSRIYGEE
jgi:hypothetical protein